MTFPVGECQYSRITKKDNSRKRPIMTKSQKALIRQTTIFSRLNAGQTVNIKELAEEFGVGIRTIQKDMNERLADTYDIVDLGHGNYRFAEGYRFAGADDEEEKIAISLMKSLQRSAIPELNGYIDSAIPTVKNYEEMFIFDLDFESIEDIGTFKIILQAIKWKVGIEFEYTKNDGSIKEVTVHPYRIANFKNYWYLIAYDLLGEKIKSYYLKKIDKLRTLYENFIPDEATQKELETICDNIDSAWYSGGESECLLRVSGDARFYLQRHLPKHMRILEEKEKYAIMSISYNSDIEVIALVKKWMPDINIIGNEQIEERISEDLRKYLDRK